MVMLHYIGFGKTPAFPTHRNVIMTPVCMPAFLLSLLRRKVQNDITR